ncbi:MAG TPA: phage holin, LLH family [Thermomicrobiales bacterium]|nr:phage holin, LLH family [Thermomicrobiales bacterium]
MSADLTRLLVELAAYAITSGAVARAFVRVMRYAEAHLSARQALMLDTLARQAVGATEQLAGSKLDNAQKRQAAADRLAALCLAHGVPLDASEIDIVIEAAVNALPPTNPQPDTPLALRHVSGRA